MRLFALLALSAVLVPWVQCAPLADSDAKLADEFFVWRAKTAPYTNDDIPRMDRPFGVRRDWSRVAVEQRRADLAAFEARWRKLEDPGASVAHQVDHRLLGSAIARVHWELDILKQWQRDPNFYLEQTLAPMVEALTLPGPYDEASSREILARLDAVPGLIQQAEATLQAPPAPFARLAIDSLAGIRGKFQQVAATLPSQTTIPAADWQASADRAAAALEGYRSWLEQSLPALPAHASLGRAKYEWFLQNVALIPYTPEQLLVQAELEASRAEAFEALEANRNRDVPPLTMAATLDEFIARNQKAEASVREFLESRGILTLPPWLHHYTLRAMPPYLAPLADFAEADDFTSPARLDQDGIRYMNPPSPDAGFFWVSDAMDPRISIVHEGTVGHYGQLCISWKHPDPIRRHYYDSGANEGIGFYAEEMMLQAGLYDDSPHSREIVYRQMRLRALRVIVDVKIALGQFTLDQAASFLERQVPMTAASARAEVIETTEAPGQKISYQTGKLQIEEMMQEARLKQGDAFSLREFHDSVWLNGNVPIALQRWEYLGADDEMKKLGVWTTLPAE